MSAHTRVVHDLRHKLQSERGTFAAFQVTQEGIENFTTDSNALLQQTGLTSLSPRRRAAQVAGMNGYNASPDLPPPLYVRALYNYEADDPTSLSFRQGDIIHVITQLESGWWDGVINDVRGWFPSNYCQVLSDLDDLNAGDSQDESEVSAESGTEDEEYEEDVDSDVQTGDEDSDLPARGAGSQAQEEAAFWIPQATPDGRLFYFNTLTGVSTMELPLETPSSPHETGPRNRDNFHVPEQTRPPPEMMAGGYQQEKDYDGSASEAEVEKTRTMSASTAGRKGSNSSGTLGASSMDSRTTVSLSRGPDPSFSQAGISMAPLGTTATSFTANPNGAVSATGTPKYFVDDGTLPPVTWNALVDNMRASVDAYRHAVTSGQRAEYVRKAEDISDHLRMLLAAGSGTTDNHSGNPSIISTNRPLYPHFREMMSKFSKLVLSSHIAAADWPTPEAGSKCLHEADGVMRGVYGFVDVARQQRGDELPRLVPGFVAGGNVGGHWRDNNIDNQFVTDGSSFAEVGDEKSRLRPSVPLDTLSLRGIEEARLSLLSSLRRLEDRLQYQDKVVTPIRQREIGDAVCLAAGAVIDHFRPWISLVESIDLGPIGNVFQKPSLLDFAAQKQKVYDSIGDIVAACQATTAPLHDEWAETRGESMDARLSTVRTICRQLDSHIAQVNYSLQLLEPTTVSQNQSKREHRMTDGGETYQNAILRGEPAHAVNRPNKLGDVGQSKSYTVGQGPPERQSVRRSPKDKAQNFFGQAPPASSNIQAGNTNPGPASPSEIPWYLELDHLGEVTYDTKNNIHVLKSGTLTGLVEQLTRHDRPDTSFNTTFLLTYRSFISAAELFQFLVQRFNIQPPQGLTMEEMQIWEENKQKPVRFRVVNILKQWLEHYWMESNDAESHQLLERMNSFARNTIMNTKIPGAGPLVTVIDQRLKGQDTSAKRLILTLTGSAPPPILPKNMKKMKFLDIDPTEFARQLTITESRLYGKIRPVECLERIWEKKDKSGTGDRAPNIQSLILHSNQLTNWVAEMILSFSEPKKRVMVIKHFVSIADRCRFLNNFSTLTAIVSALGTAPILRLNRTWGMVNQKTKDVLESMRTLISSTKNFAKYREVLHAANPPCIPFLGVYLTDLTFIEDGIASVIKNTELINFTKRHRTAEVIRDIQQYQNVPYTLNPVSELQDWILENMRSAGDVHEMYDKSLDIEPREREEEKIARLLSESGFL